MRRTEWVEQFVTDFAARPLVRECVFFAPRYLNRGVEHEVCDLLFVLKNRAIVLQIKAQEDPEARTGEKLERWIRKQSAAAEAQVRGALATLRREAVWCMHPRLGRVDFSPGQLQVLHGVALVEARDQRLTLEQAPRDANGTPVAIFDANDFLNVLDQLRTFPDLADYLTRRAQLGEDVRGTVGGERILLEHYILNDGFDGWPGYAAAAQLSGPERAARDDRMRKRTARDQYWVGYVEHVADTLAERSATYSEGLTPETLAGFDPDDRRTRYRTMQDVLCDLPLACQR